MSFEKTGGIFAQAFTLKLPKLPNAAQHFDEASAQSLDILLENRKLGYVAGKKFFDEKDAESKHGVTVITTPHPIANLSAVQCLMLDVISLVSNILARYHKADESGTRKKYSKNFVGNKIDEYLLETAKQLLILDNTKILALKVARDNFKRDGDVNALQVALARIVMAMGIPTKVIGAQEQANAARVRDARIRTADKRSPIEVQTWRGADGDGDPKNPMSNIITWGKDKTLLAMYKDKPKSLNQTTVQPRLSCKDKKGVTGIIKQLQNIPGAKEIADWLVLFDKDAYDAAYAKYKIYLENARYNAVSKDGTSQSNSEDKDHSFINNPLDLILRVAAPAFTKADGFVLSDFDSSKKNVMPALRFILQATEQYLREKTGKSISIKQTIMPLCENQHSIAGAAELFSEYLQSVDLAIAAECTGKITKEQKAFWIKKVVFPHDKIPFYGAFYGPSDLTKDMGGQSINRIVSSIEALRLSWAQFMESHKTFFGIIQIPEFKIEFGKGTSPKRGGGFTLPYSPTVQGSNIVTWDSVLMKTQARGMVAQNKDPSGSHVGGDFIKEAIIKEAIEFHEKILNENNGYIVTRFDTLRSSPMLSILTPNYSNNQGTRGNEENPLFKDQRAIASAATTSLIGLLSAPGFPEDPKGSGYDVLKAVKDPADLHILMYDLFQIASLDFERAVALKFTEEEIKPCRDYANNVLRFLCNQVGVNNDEKMHFADRVGNLVEEIIKATPDKTAQIVLRQFQAQIPLIKALQKTLTATVSSAKGQSGDKLEQTKANAAFVNSLIANFQMPMVPAYGYKRGVVNNDNSKERKPWVQLLGNREARQAAYGVSPMVSKL